METALIPYHAVKHIAAESVLVLAPHPDDEVLGCGGAILRHVAAGVPVHVVILTDGAFNANEKEQLIEIRESESRKASVILGYGEPEFWRYPDRGLIFGESLIQRINHRINSLNVNLVYAPSLIEMHPDHRVVAMCAIEAVRRAPSQPLLALYEVGVPLSPNLLLDISDLAERKMKAMRCFVSQNKKQRYDLDLAALNRYRTYTLSEEVTSAEAYILTSSKELENDPFRLYQPEHKRQKALGLALDDKDVPLVSVIIRSTDRATLSEALDSVALQTYSNIEVLVVNAKGGCHSKLEDWCGLYPLRRIDSSKALRRSCAANLGLSNARGQYLIFLDDDDWFMPEHIWTLVALLNNPLNSDCIAAYAGVKCVEQKTGDVIRLFNYPYNPTTLKIENYIPIHALLFHRNVIDSPRNCRFDESLDLFEDWDFWLQLQAYGKFIWNDQITATYRIAHGLNGNGLFENETYAINSLNIMIEKWRNKWSTSDIIEIIAHSRLLNDLLRKTESLRFGLDKDNQQLTLQLSSAAQDNQQLTLQLSSAHKELENSRNAYDLLLNSYSWQLTKPLRYIRRVTTKNTIKTTVFKNFIWKLAVKSYKYKHLEPLIKIIPFNLKHLLKSLLIPRNNTKQKTIQGLKPKVSIIIPIYNHAIHLQKCIDSALAQTYDNLEIVLCDDFSSDADARKIINQYFNNKKIKILYSEENKGISVTQNRLLIESTGDVIAFLDCDDYLACNAIEVAMNAWKTNTVYLHTGRVNIDENGVEINRISFEHLPKKDYFSENLNRMFATHLKIIRRDAFAKVGLFDPRFDSAQDYDMLMRIAFHYPTESFVHIPDKLYFHRLHNKQTSTSLNEIQLANTRQIQKEANMRQEIRNGIFIHFISIIMLSYGKKEQTLEALLSLKNTINIPHEIILFDNGSALETVEFIKKHIENNFENLKVFYNTSNLGPAAGRRQALQYASGDWFIIFDNDEIAETGWLEELLVRASSDENIGAVCCKVIFPDETLQFSGGELKFLDDNLVTLDLHDKGKNAYDLESAQFRDCDWCPIGATLFTINPASFLHEGYPNVFEDAGVSMALKRAGKRLVNSPGSWVWHEHMVYRKNIDMKDRYVNDRYDPVKMIKSLKSFYKENGLIIKDEYVWRENGLNNLSREDLVLLLTSN